MRSDAAAERRLEESRERPPEPSGWFIGVGILWLVLGVLAILAPFVAALAVELVLGAVLLVGGVVQVVQAFRTRDWGAFGLRFVGGLLAAVVGLLLLFLPVEGVLTLTLLLAAFFIVSGVLQVIWALGSRDRRNWGWVLASGILAFAVGFLIWAGWPSTATWALGILVGIELIFVGLSLIMLGSGARQARAV